MFSFQYLIRCLVPDVPFDVDIFLERKAVFNEKLIDLTADDDFEEAREEYARLNKVRSIVGDVRASMLTDEEMKKYMPTEQTETEKARQIRVKQLFGDATEQLKVHLAQSEVRNSEVDIAGIELVADTNLPKNPRASADLRLTFAIDEMTRYSESAPPNPLTTDASPRFQASEEPIREEEPAEGEAAANKDEEAVEGGGEVVAEGGAEEAAGGVEEEVAEGGEEIAEAGEAELEAVEEGEPAEGGEEL